ncbi:hypothetical protein JKI95_05995 [Corynebacterium aquatimens]|uniref:hypothetical protein n=1 Tax=Corynebacterium TaxID=1716 RepID=UPI001F1C575F|nr:MULTISPECIES: hypothetical protein [Corynebacterium]QYH20396.1 hypothetical protein JKI95_05995 [Corynebacterium aquatimens]UIZ92299.1 hypothetical protein JZY91_00280 [Corynebacterium sp. CNCTC7651]
MSTRRIIATAATATIAATALAPAHAATIGPRAADNTCKVTLSKAEQAFGYTLFDDSKKLGDHEHARDIIRAVETVYPNAAKDPAALPEGVKATYEQARATFAATSPTDKITLEGRDYTHNYRVEADPKTETSAVPDATFQLAKDSTADADTLTKLTAAWLATPSGDVAKRQAAFDKAERQAKEACRLKTSTAVAYPEAATASTLDLSSKLSSAPSNFDKVASAVIGVLVALFGVFTALPKLGIKLPF